MKTGLFKACAVLGMLLFAYGCGGGGGSGGGGGETPVDAALVLESSVAPGDELSQGGNATIVAKVTDANGNKVADGTIVTFTATAGTITPTAVTIGGKAEVTYLAGNSGGVVTINGTSGALSDSLSIQVATGMASTITFVSANPLFIGVKSSGQPESTTLTFKVLDSGNNPVSGATVQFAIATPLGGGETISPAQAITSGGGLVTANLQSGSVAGAISVTASIAASGISTTAKVIVVAGLPDSQHFSLTTSKRNLPGYTYFGEKATITARVADRFSNPVPANTPVYFTSEAGAMALTQAYTNTLGQATADHITQAPTPDAVSAVTGGPGISTILAWTPGQEAYNDANGNGRFDAGDTLLDDLGEPYIDADDDDSHDKSERYVDLNGDGIYNGPNGVWDGNTFVWTTINILWSYAVTNGIDLTVTPGAGCPGFVIPDGGSCTCTVEVADLNGNPIYGGSKLTIDPSANQTVITPEEFTIPDAILPGADTTAFNFTITNNGMEAGQDYPVTVILNVPTIAGYAAFEKKVPIAVTESP